MSEKDKARKFMDCFISCWDKECKSRRREIDCSFEGRQPRTAFMLGKSNTDFEAMQRNLATVPVSEVWEIFSVK